MRKNNFETIKALIQGISGDIIENKDSTSNENFGVLLRFYIQMMMTQKEKNQHITYFLDSYLENKENYLSNN